MYDLFRSPGRPSDDILRRRPERKVLVLPAVSSRPRHELNARDHASHGKAMCTASTCLVQLPGLPLLFTLPGDIGVEASSGSQRRDRAQRNKEVQRRASDGKRSCSPGSPRPKPIEVAQLAGPKTLRMPRKHRGSRNKRSAPHGAAPLSPFDASPGPGPASSTPCGSQACSLSKTPRACSKGSSRAEPRPLRIVSNLTISDMQIAGPDAILRGGANVHEALREAQVTRAKLARARLDTARQASRAQRSEANERVRLRRERSALSRQVSSANDRADSPEPDALVNTEVLIVSPAGRRRSALPLAVNEEQRDAFQEFAMRFKIMGPHMQNSAVSSRVKRLARAGMKTKLLMAQAVREEAAFESLSEAERNIITAAVVKAIGGPNSNDTSEAADKSEGSGGDGEAAKKGIKRVDTLVVTDPKHLVDALGDVGLMGKSVAEKREVFILCDSVSWAGPVTLHSFAVNLVPMARDMLNELQRQQLKSEFELYDEDGSGFIDEDECINCLERRCGSSMDGAGLERLRKECIVIFRELRDEKHNTIKLDGFQALIFRLRETHGRIRVERERAVAAEAALSPEEVKAVGRDLLWFHDMFLRQDLDRSGWLDRKGVRDALIECGFLPDGDADREHVLEVVDGLVGTGDIDFSEFLQVIWAVRLECRKLWDQEALEREFQKYDRDRDGVLSLADASEILTQLGISPRCSQDRDEIGKLLLEVDVDGSGTLDFDEFQMLVQLISEKLQSEQGLREHKTAVKLGLTAEEVAELRALFHSLKKQGNGEVGITECRHVCSCLRKTVSSDDLRDMFSTINLSGSDGLKFEEFLHLVKAIQEPSSSWRALATSKARFLPSAYYHAW